MLYFMSDYTEGAHPKVLEALEKSNLVSQPGYGDDCFCAAAREKIRQACAKPEADVYFLVGGTQTNLAVISALLRRWEGVLCTETGHIAVHEAGAIELSGHKVLPLPSHGGKLRAGELEAWIDRFYADETHDHMVFPGMVYLSWPTELGTLYSRAELGAIVGICRRHEIPLFIDGARLGYGLAAVEDGLTLPELAELADVFYIGGTKVGALCGEAVVFPKGDMPKHFPTMAKQHGAMLAKGRLLGAQFDALFTDGLYFALGRHAVDLAMKLKAAFVEKGYPLYLDSPTNQQFVILTPEQEARLKQSAAFERWEPLPDGRVAVRFVTSWASTKAQVDALIALL